MHRLNFGSTDRLTPFRADRRDGAELTVRHGVGDGAPKLLRHVLAVLGERSLASRHEVAAFGTGASFYPESTEPLRLTAR